LSQTHFALSRNSSNSVKILVYIKKLAFTKRPLPNVDLIVPPKPPSTTLKQPTVRQRCQRPPTLSNAIIIATSVLGSFDHSIGGDIAQYACLPGYSFSPDVSEITLTCRRSPKTGQLQWLNAQEKTGDYVPDGCQSIALLLPMPIR